MLFFILIILSQSQKPVFIEGSLNNVYKHEEIRFLRNITINFPSNTRNGDILFALLYLGYPDYWDKPINYNRSWTPNIYLSPGSWISVNPEIGFPDASPLQNLVMFVSIHTEYYPEITAFWSGEPEDYFDPSMPQFISTSLSIWAFKHVSLHLRLFIDKLDFSDTEFNFYRINPDIPPLENSLLYYIIAPFIYIDLENLNYTIVDTSPFRVPNSNPLIQPSEYPKYNDGDLWILYRIYEFLPKEPFFQNIRINFAARYISLTVEFPYNDTIHTIDKVETPVVYAVFIVSLPTVFGIIILFLYARKKF